VYVPRREYSGMHVECSGMHVERGTDINQICYILILNPKP